jgi:hypothetical protein
MVIERLHEERAEGQNGKTRSCSQGVLDTGEFEFLDPAYRKPSCDC